MLNTRILRPTVLIIALVAAAPAWASSAPAASAQLDASHWSLRAVERLNDLGLIEGYLPAQNAVPREVVRWAMEQAEAAARERRPALQELVRTYRARFDEEFRTHAVSPEAALALTEASAYAGFEGAGARAAEVDVGAVPDSLAKRALIRPGSNVEEPLGGVSVAGRLTSHLELMARPQLQAGTVDVSRWEAVAAVNPVSLSVGRGPIAYGLQGERGLVLSGKQSFDRVELSSTRPVRLPFFLRHIGLIAADAFFSRISEARHLGDPFFWGANIRVQPHPRLTLSLQRAVMVGGGVRQQGTAAHQIFKHVFALRNQLENNVAALSARWRLPTESLVPLTAYTEWGADDLGGEIEGPGLQFGLRTPMLPGAPAVSAGAEFTFIGALCCQKERPNWYAHGIHQGGWVLQEAPLGHPLAGDGREYRIYGAADLLESRLRVEGAVFARARFSQNLYSPLRSGQSAGISSSVLWRLSERGELGVALAGERGQAWREGSVRGHAALYF